MSSRGRLRRACVCLLAGLATTLILAWALPLLLALRGISPQSATEPLVLRPVSHAPGADEARSGSPELLASRGLFSDLVVARRSEEGRWPSTPLRRASTSAGNGARDVRGAWSEIESVPTGWIVAPGEREDPRRWREIATTLTGFPFRAFAGESRLATLDEPSVATNVDAVEIGESGGVRILLPLRPLPIGLALDVFIWGAVAWSAVAFPAAWRRRRRERLGRCGSCGFELDPHATSRPARCPKCGGELPRDPLGFARSPEMHFQNRYVWLVFLSSLDVMLTWKILEQGGTEINPIAAAVIDTWGMNGATAFKFALVIWVVVVCETLARLRPSAGRFLATVAVVISAFPVCWSLALLTLHRLFPQFLQG